MTPLPKTHPAPFSVYLHRPPLSVPRQRAHRAPQDTMEPSRSSSDDAAITAGVLKTSASAAAAALNTAAKDAAATCATSRKPLPANHIAQTTSRLLRSAEENDVVRCQNDAARVSEMNAGQPMANDAPAVPQTPLGIYHNPADQRICVCGRWGEPDECSRRWPAANLATWQGKLICFCYVTGVLAFAVFMVVNCSTTDACRRDRD